MPESICSKLLSEALDEEHLLSYKKLATYLEFAEGLEEIRKTGKAVIELRTAGIRERRLVSNPPDTSKCGRWGQILRGRSLQKKDRLRNRMETGTNEDLKCT